MPTEMQDLGHYSSPNNEIYMRVYMVNAIKEKGFQSMQKR